MWVVPIDTPLNTLHFRRLKKKILKDPGPLKTKNLFEWLNNSSRGVIGSCGVRG